MCFFFCLTSVLVLSLISFSNFFAVWFSLEIFTWLVVSFLLSSKSHQFLRSVCWKYFITQFVSSVLFLLSFLLFPHLEVDPFFSEILLCLSLIVKLGVPPFHGWVIQVSENLSWKEFYFANFLAKIGPVVIFVQALGMSLIHFTVLFLFMVGSMGGIFQFSLQRFMVFSSILNMSWIVSSSGVSLNSTMIYTISYLVFFLFIFDLFEKMGTFTTQKNISFPLPFSEKVWLMVLMFTVSGMPPLVFFFLKVHIISSLISQNLILVSFLLISTSAVFSYMYTIIALMILLNKSGYIRHNTQMSLKNQFFFGFLVYLTFILMINL